VEKSLVARNDRLTLTHTWVIILQNSNKEEKMKAAIWFEPRPIAVLSDNISISPWVPTVILA